MTIKSLWLCCFVPLCIGSILVGCKSDGGKEDLILRLSAEEALEKGTLLMDGKKYSQAVRYLEHAFEIAPNSTTGREALLLAADALYFDGGTANFIKAESKYRDFQNRFPTSERADYVQLQIARCLSKQVLKPDRDQSATRRAMVAYDNLLRVYPTSALSGEATQGIADLRQRLAEHDYIVGRYNYKRRLYVAAASRFEILIEEYPDFQAVDKALFMLGKSQMKSKKIGDAEKTFDRLRSEYPESSYSHKIPKLPEIPPDPELEPNPGEEEPTENEEDDSGAESDS